MARLTIPSSEYQVLKKLVDLDDAVFSSFVTSVGEIDPNTLMVDTAERIAKSVPQVREADLTAFLKTIYSLYAAKRARKSTASQVGDDLSETASVEKPELFPDAKRILLAKRVTTLLSIDKTVGLTSKAVDVMTEQKNIYITARVVSDIRPVFDDSPEKISAAMVIHNLCIHFSESGKHNDLYVALNTTDLTKLKEVIERAEKKSATLQAFIKKSEIPYFEDRG